MNTSSTKGETIQWRLTGDFSGVQHFENSRNRTWNSLLIKKKKIGMLYVCKTEKT